MSSKTVFIPAPFFPPSAMPPSQRVRLLVRHLHEFGWRPIVFTVDSYYREEDPDPWMLEIAGTEYEKIQVKAWDQRKTRKLGLGDLGIRSYFGLLRSMQKQAKKHRPELILYPVPPWYIMVMAPFIKRITGIPYVIDYIDPWIYPTAKQDLKAKLSRTFAKLMEGRVVKNSSAIIAVSKGILDDLKKRYPSINGLPMAAIPYGVEVSDYDSIHTQKKNEQGILIRYTGAISENMLVVVDSLLKAFKRVNAVLPLQIIFTGTSYAGIGHTKPVLTDLIQKNGVSDFVKENPSRVSYREALEMSKQADMQLLVGDTTPYYAASKMMGLVASGKPFFAWVHSESFPAKFLEELKYPYRMVYTTGELGNESKIESLAETLLSSIKKRDSYVPVPIEDPVFAKFTAQAMTKSFVDTFKKIN